MLQITITVKERDADEIIRIGRKSWKTTTPEERKDFDRLISYYGTAVIKAVTDSLQR